MPRISLCRPPGPALTRGADASVHNSLKMWRTQVALSRDGRERVRKEADNFE